MRTRLLANPGALADYEIIEMLLFLGIPRRDTKPQAKGLLLQFGTYAAVLTAARDGLRAAALPDRVIDAFALVSASATQLARAERTERVVLSDWDALDRYFDPVSRPMQKTGHAALFLNNRNQLLADCMLPPDAPLRTLSRTALDRHATAAILVRQGGVLAPTAMDRAFLGDARAATCALSLLIHDMVVVTGGGWLSLEQDQSCSDG